MRGYQPAVTLAPRECSGQRAEQERQRAQRSERAGQQAEQERRLLLTQAIRRLHGLGQDAEAIAAALAVDADEVRRVLSG